MRCLRLEIGTELRHFLGFFLLTRFMINTVELQWLEHLWDYENVVETGVVRAIKGLLQSQVRRHNRDILSIFFNMKVYCVFSLESPQRGDSNEYTQDTMSQCKKENHPKSSQICNYGICSKGPKNEFETAVVNEPSVFEPLKFHCTIQRFLSCAYGPYRT